MLLPSAIHVSSTFEFGVVFLDCLSADHEGSPAFSPFSEPHEFDCLGLFMCPPLSSLELCFMIALVRTLKAILHSHLFSEPHQCYSLGLFMCAPLSSLEVCVVIA